MFTLQRTKVHGGALFTEQANCRSLFSFLWTIGSTLESRHCSLLHVRSVFCAVYWAPYNLQGILCILHSGLYIIQFKLCSTKYTAQCAKHIAHCTAVQSRRRNEWRCLWGQLSTTYPTLLSTSWQSHPNLHPLCVYQQICLDPNSSGQGIPKLWKIYPQIPLSLLSPLITRPGPHSCNFVMV